MPEPVYVVATFQVKPGKQAQAEKILKGLLAPTHEEAGCVTYTAHRRLDQPGTYYFIEKWRSQSELDQHLNSRHIQDLRALSKDLFAVADVARIEPMAGGDPIKGLLFK
jgi:quinol monooxygenase YgiN